MIIYKQGDLLSTTDPFIAHGCNSQGVMGAGVAKAIANRYPWVAEKFDKTYKYEVFFWGKEGISLGGCYEYTQRDAPYRILNLITQRRYGRTKGTRYVSYDAVDVAFQAVHALIKDAPISIPKIGCGLGGGSWPVVAAIIDQHLPLNMVTVWSLE